MTISNPKTAGEAVRGDATEAARRILTAISIGVIAPESYTGKLHCQDRLIEYTRMAFEKARAEATAIAAAARTDIDGLRRSELMGGPFTNECFGPASRSVGALSDPLDTEDIQIAIAALVTKALEDACGDVDRNSVSKLKTRKGTERKRRRLKAEVDAFLLKLTPVMAAHIAGLVRDELSGELVRRHEACERSQSALRRRCAEATDPGDDIPGLHRFSCGPRAEVVLKAAATRRPDLLDRHGRPTDAIWPAFGAAVAAGNLGVMEDAQDSIEALQRFLESTVADALDGLTLDALYGVTQEPPEAPSWIGRAAARLQAVSREAPYRVRLAQVPAGRSDALFDQILHHIQTATRAEEDNRLQLVELTYAFCADEILRADSRGLQRVLIAILPHASNPQLAKALGAQLPNPGAVRTYAVDGTAGNGATPGVVRPGSPAP